jgi:tetratricopeptide (TPR) repeat protein
MNFMSTQCPACGKDIQIPRDVDQAVCMYCGHRIAGPSARGASGGPSIENLLGMARTAELAGNNEEALSYYNRVLELDPRIADAWIGKGKAAAWQSSLAHVRSSEMLVAFKNALANTEQESYGSTSERLAGEFKNFSIIIFNMSVNHLVEFISDHQTWFDHQTRAMNLLTDLQGVRTWCPTHKETLEAIIHIGNDLIGGVSFRDPYDNTPRVWHIEPEAEAVIRSAVDDAIAALQSLDPSYAAPKINKAKADACFVVTAAAGDPGHPAVVSMRNFRDRWILQQSWGDAFVTWYYRHGPKAAGYLRKHRLLRNLVYWFAVLPVSRVVDALLRNRI